MSLDTHHVDAMAFLEREDASHTESTTSRNSAELSSETRLRRRRKAHGSEHSARATNASDKASRKTSHRHRRSSSPRTHTSPKQDQTSSFKSQAPIQDDGRSFLPSLSRIIESSPGIGAGRWDTTTTQEVSDPSSRDYEEYGQGPQNRARHRHLKPRTRGLTSPSTNSVLSTMTAATGSSSGSGSTVTQRSYDSTRDHRASQTTKGSINRGSSPGMDSTQHEQHNQRSPEKLNVFKFMIHDEAEEDHIHDVDEPLWQSDSSSSSDNESLRPQRPYTPTSSITRDSSESPDLSFKQIRAAPYLAESLHSDSGIFVRGSSSEGSERPDQVPHTTHASEHGLDSHEGAPLHPSAYTAHHHWQRRYSNASDYSGYHSAAPQYQPMYPVSSMIPYKQSRRDQECLPPTTEATASPYSKPLPIQPSGYDLLASELTTGSRKPESGCVFPLYRKFECLNHRILLHLQDEMSEMEEHLEKLDQAIARKDNQNDMKSQPASRRRESRHGGELEAQRTELLGRIFLKMKQYNKAISAYHSMTTAASPATDEEVHKYRSLMQKLQPVAEEELRFLEHNSDLLRFPGRDQKPAATSSNIPATAVMMVCLLMMMPFAEGSFRWAGFLCLLVMSWIAQGRK